MGKLGSFALAIVGLLFCLTASAADAPDISGKLLDVSGKAVANASVQLIYAELGSGTYTGRDVGRVTTDAQGQFRFSKAFTWEDSPAAGQLPPRYCLYAAPTAAGVGYLNLEKSDASENLTLQLAEREVVPVVVVDAEGKPVPQARVWIMMALKDMRGREPKGILLIPRDVLLGEFTNEEGKLDVVVPPGAKTIIAVEKDGYVMGLGEKQITLYRGGTVTGRVFDAEGKPVPNAKVTMVMSHQGFIGSSGLTDAEGRYQVKDVAAEGYTAEMFGQKQPSNGQVTVSVVHPTSAALVGSATLTLKPGQTATQDVTFETKLEISGQVVDVETDQPLPGIRVQMFSHPRQGGGSSDSGMATTDAKGHFSFATRRNNGVQIMMMNQGGDYLIDEAWQQQAASRGNQGFNTQSLTEPKTDLKLPLKLRKLAPLAGKVVDSAGKPVAKASVTIPGVAPVTTDAEGNFAFKAAPTDRAGQLTVIGNDLGVIAPIEAEQKQINITALPLVARECVFMTPEGTPADKLSFTLMIQSGLNSYSGINDKPKETDAQGKCRLDKLIVGAQYRASWSPKGEYSNGNAQFTVDSSDAPMRVTAPKYNNKFFLIVENEDGDPVEGAQLQFRNMNMLRNDQWGKVQNLKSDAQGSMRLENIGGGILRLEVIAKGYRRHSVVAQVKDGEQVAMLTKDDAPARHNVLVLTADGKPAANVAVRVFTQRNEGKALQTDAEGRLETSIPNNQGDMTLFCKTADMQWGVANLQSYSDGSSIMKLNKAITPRKLRLVTADGKPLAKAKINISQLYDQSGNESGYMEQISFHFSNAVQTELSLLQVTDDNGMVTFPQVDSRFSGNVQIEANGYGNQNKQFQTTGSAAEVEMRIQKLAKVTGKLVLPRAAGTRPEQYYVRAQPTEQMRGGGGNQTGVRPDCTFEFALEPGEYRMTATAQQGEESRYLVRIRPVVKLLPSETTTVELVVQEGISVRGKYVAKDGKVVRPLPKMAIQIEENMGINPRAINADGSFEFFVPRAGEYRVYIEQLAQPNSYRNEMIKVPSEEAVENLVIKGE